MHLIAALTLLAAQQVYGPFQHGPREFAPVVAAAPHGMLLAWSEIEPGARTASIHVALLNHDAERIGPVHRLAPTTKNVHATAPVIATNHDTFFVAWLERDRFSLAARDAAGVLLDGNGAPLRGTESFGPIVAGTPSVVWTGVDYRVYGAASWSVSPQGHANIMHFGVASQRVPFATPDANGWVDWSNDGPTPRPCITLCGGILTSPPSYNLDFAVISRDWIRSGRIRETGFNGQPPAVVPDGDDLLIVWSTPRGLKAQRVDDGEVRQQPFTHPDRRTFDASLSAAGSLVVFDSDSDVFGTVVGRDGFGPVFPIAAGDDFHAQARVTRVGEHRYLVTWIRNGSHIAAQFVETAP